MTNSPLEFLARKYDNVVIYDAYGNPSIFVKFPKMKSIDLDSSLPDHTHPAFIINGVEQDYILIGKYKAAELVSGGTLYSLPSMPPKVNATADEFLSRMKNAGIGISGKTMADSGFLLLLAQKYGWDPKGNTNYGSHHLDAAWSVSSTNYAVGNRRSYHGWLYECIQAHTSGLAILPDSSPNYWRRVKFIGGIEANPTSRDVNNPVTKTTLNGSGPLDWYLDGTGISLADIVGNVHENSYGFRTVDLEIQILENNNAADPSADLSVVSSAWKAILPHSSDDGYDLVAPGTAGTLHWNLINDILTLDTVEPAIFDNVEHQTAFKDVVANSSNLPFVPCIVRELGIFPTPGSNTRGLYRILFKRELRMARTGGSWTNLSNSGLGYIYISFSNESRVEYIGARPRAIQSSEDQQSQTQ